MTVTVNYTFVNDENSEEIMGKVAKAIEQIVKEVNNKEPIVTDQASDLKEGVTSTDIRNAILRHCKTSKDQLEEAGIPVDSTVTNEAKEIVRDVCNNVLQRVIDENGVTDLGTCGIDMSKPENIITVALAVEASSNRDGTDVIFEQEHRSVIDIEEEIKKLNSTYYLLSHPAVEKAMNEAIEERSLQLKKLNEELELARVGSFSKQVQDYREGLS